MKTVLITGCSSGFGLDTARHFLAQGWQVVATMRTPGANVLPPSERLRVLPLDVTDPTSIRAAVEAAGPIDVLVNNAGFGAAAPIELAPLDVVRRLFETNTFGTLAVAQAVLPQMRERRDGVIVNVTSSVTLKSLPLVGAYRASKAAANALTETMALELAPLGVRVHIVLPGRAPETRFGQNARERMTGFAHPAYADYAGKVLGQMMDATGPTTRSKDVAEAVWRAATDASAPLRIPAGADAVAWAAEAA